MRSTYQPKHMKEPDRMRMNRFSLKPIVTAGLIGAMVAPNVLAPAAALATEVDVDDADTSAVEEVTVDTSFSTATQRLIAANATWV